MKKFYVLMFVFMSFCNIAVANDKYAVEVYEDITEKDSSTAKEKAMTSANRKAFLEIASKVMDTKYLPKFEEFTDEQILTFIKEVGVSEEKSSSYRYSAKLMVVIDGNLLLEYMKENNIPAMLNEQKSATIIPIFYVKNSVEPKLWEDDNLWYNIWQQKEVVYDRNIQFSVISADYSNQLTATEFLNADKKLANLLTQYNPQKYIYTVSLSSDDFNYLNVDIVNLKTGEKSNISMYGTPDDKNLRIAKDMVIARIKNEIFNSSENIEKKPAKANLGQNEMMVVYAYNHPAEVVELRKILASLPEVKDTVLRTFGNGKVKLLLHIIANPEQVSYSIFSAGYGVKKENNMYVITKGTK